VLLDARVIKQFLFIAIKLINWHYLLVALLFLYPIQILMSAQNELIIDDRKTGDLHAISGNEWNLVTDGVMGGVSKGQLSLDSIEAHPCLRMRGDVRLENNGGFVQIALDLSDDVIQDISKYSGVFIEVYGNNEQYNIHLRTQDIWLPWQSYRATFTATPEWKTLYVPFAEFTPYRIDKALNKRRLKRIGLVAIGRKFNADLCIGKVGFYRLQE
jgi:hypothetical protein